jgi:hypothetical protein
MYVNVYVMSILCVCVRVRAHVRLTMYTHINLMCNLSLIKRDDSAKT